MNVREMKAKNDALSARIAELEAVIDDFEATYEPKWRGKHYTDKEQECLAAIDNHEPRNIVLIEIFNRQERRIAELEAIVENLVKEIHVQMKHDGGLPYHMVRAYAAARDAVGKEAAND